MSRIAPYVIPSLLMASGEPIKRTRFMKLMFLIGQETSIGRRFAYYDFLPYKYGPYSFSLDKDLAVLESEQLVVREKRDRSELLFVTSNKVLLNSLVHQRLNAEAQLTVSDLVRKYRPLSD